MRSAALQRSFTSQHPVATTTRIVAHLLAKSVTVIACAFLCISGSAWAQTDPARVLSDVPGFDFKSALGSSPLEVPHLMQLVFRMALATVLGASVAYRPWRRLMPSMDPPEVGARADLDLDAARARRLDRAAKLATVAAGAVSAPREGTGMILGNAFGNLDACAAFMHRLIEKGPRLASPAEFPNLVPSSPVGHTSIYLALRGPVFATQDLAASGESAARDAA